MAQWMGQFTGRTHSTKVAVLEDSIRKSVAAARTAEEDEIPERLKNIKRLAERLLSARIKMLKRRGSSNVPEIWEGGTAAILEEFEVEEIFEREDRKAEQGSDGKPDTVAS